MSDATGPSNAGAGGPTGIEPGQILDGLLEGLQVVGPDLRYAYVNDAAASHGRTTKDNLLGRTMTEVYPGIEKTEMFALLRACMQDRTPRRMENEFTFPDGLKGWFELRFEPVPDGVAILSLDVDARKRAELAVHGSNRALTVLSACNQTLVRAAGERQFMQDVCRVVVEKGGYRMAWIGLSRAGTAGGVDQVAWAGFDEGYLDTARTMSEADLASGPVATAIRTGQAVVVRFIATDERVRPWKAAALARGYASGLTLPFSVGGRTIGALTILSAEPDAFDEAERRLLEEMALDLGFGVESLRVRVERAEVDARNRALLDDSLAAVTAQVEAESRLRESEERYRLLLEHAPVGIAVHSEGKVVFANPAGARILGFGSPDELVGTPIEDIVHPDAWVAARDRVARLLAGETGLYPTDDRYLRKDGSIAEVEVMAVPLVFRGRPAVQVIVADITERRRAERALAREQDALRASAERWSGTFDAITDIVSVISKEHTIVEINDAGCSTLGLPRAQIIGRKCFELVHGTASPIAACPCTTAGRTLEPAVSEWEQGGRTYELAAWPLLGPDRRLEAFVHVVKDVTEHVAAVKELEEGRARTRAVYEHLPNATFVWQRHDRDFVLADFNEAARVLTEGGVAERVGKSSSEPPLAFPRMEEDLATCFERRVAVRREVDCPVPGAREPRRFVLTYGFIPSDMVILHTEDVTERRRTEEQLKLSQRLEAVGRLAGGVAHDFNNMLSVILAYAGFAADAVRASDPLHADILEIQNAGQRAAALTRQLLAFSRKQILEPEVLSINEVVKGIENMLRRLLGEDIVIGVHLAETLGSVMADPGQLEQVIVNLAVNARDAMPEGGKLTIGTANVEIDEGYAEQHVSVEPGRFVMLSVTDTGTGMDDATRARVFEPFFTTKEKGKGTGLGLSTVYGIVKQSGGNIWVYSELGIGTTFKVYLPRVDAPVADVKRRPPSVMATGRETVLIVEDEEAVRRLAERILRSAGYEVLSAANGGDALLLCEKWGAAVDLLIADVVMPGMSGREVASRLTTRRPALKVLHMSGYTDDAIAHHGVLSPGTRFIGKPFTAAELTRKVREVLDEGNAGAT